MALHRGRPASASFIKILPQENIAKNNLLEGESLARNKAMCVALSQSTCHGLRMQGILDKWCHLQDLRSCIHLRSCGTSGGSVSHGWLHNVHASLELDSSHGALHRAHLAVCLHRCSLVNIIPGGNSDSLQRGALSHGRHVGSNCYSVPIQEMVKRRQHISDEGILQGYSFHNSNLDLSHLVCSRCITPRTSVYGMPNGNPVLCSCMLRASVDYFPQLHKC